MYTLTRTAPNGVQTSKNFITVEGAKHYAREVEGIRPDAWVPTDATTLVTNFHGGRWTITPAKAATTPLEREVALVEATEVAIDSLSMDPADAREALHALAKAIQAVAAAGEGDDLPYEMEQAHSAYGRVRKALYGNDGGPAIWEF